LSAPWAKTFRASSPKCCLSAETVEQINRQCHSLGIKTISEYVESSEMLEQLRLSEVDFAQTL